MKKDRDTKLVTAEERKNYLFSEPIYQITKFYSENLLAIEMKTAQIFLNKPVYLRLRIK